MIPVPDGSVGDGNDFVFVSQELDGLTPETNYVFRLCAENEAGETCTDEESFRTRVETESIPGSRFFELVLPADRWSKYRVSESYRGMAAWPLLGRW